MEKKIKINGWQTLWVTDMPLFHCGSGSSIYNGTAVALLRCCLLHSAQKAKAKKVQGYTHTHNKTEADNGARFPV